MSRQFPLVNSSRGAPMGRPTIPITDCGFMSFKLFKVRLDSGGYDDGGAYWGNAYLPLYCAQCTVTGAQEFVRAYSREHAAAMLDLCNADLARPLNKQKVADLFMSWTNNRLPPQWKEVKYLGLWFEKFGHRWINR